MISIYVEDMQSSDEALVTSKLIQHSLDATLVSDKKTIFCKVSDAEEVMQVVHNVGLTPTI